MKYIKTLLAFAVFIASTFAATTQAEISANIGISNNYLWRGLTQTTDEPAISGGIDYTADSGFYAGTWVSNVQYASDDPFSYEHDIYFGFAGETGSVSYDLGYLYYNYNDDAEFDFSEVYGSIGISGFSATLSLLHLTEPDEENHVDEDGGEANFGFGSAYYLSLDYGFDLDEDWSMALHIGYHDGDFVEAFNFDDGETYNYTDYSVSFAKDAFTFTVSRTDLDESPTSLNNDDLKFVIAYSIEI